MFISIPKKPLTNTLSITNYLSDSIKFIIKAKDTSINEIVIHALKGGSKTNAAGPPPGAKKRSFALNA